MSGSRSGTTRLVLFPGLGADQRLYEPQRDAFGDDLLLPGWTTPEHGETLDTYAPRAVRAALGDVIREPYILGGVSFGGMLAIEAATRLPEPERPRAVVVLSGLRSRRALTRMFRLQAAILPLVPDAVMRWAVGSLLLGSFIRRDGLSGRGESIVRAMAADVDLPFFRWSARACARWTHDGRCPVPVHQIHGARDRIIPYVAEPDLPGAPEIIEGGGHLLNLSQPELVNRFLRESLQAAVPEADTTP